MKGQEKDLKFRARWVRDGHRQVRAELRDPGGDEPGKVVGTIRVRWQTLTESSALFGWAARMLPEGARWEPATTPDEVDVEISATMVGDEIIARAVRPLNIRSRWELRVHPVDTIWLAHIDLFPQEIPTPHELGAP
jgi:hypothetical protein